jgi:hypothetical protein
MTRLRAVFLLSLATSLFVPVARSQNTTSARPGTVNYVEGQATLNGQHLATKAVGQAEIAKGQTLTTTNGKVEVLLTPGVFLRLGDNSAVTMVSPDLTATEVQLDRGTAEVEVDQIYKENHLLIDQGPAQAELMKNGLYEFDANANQLRVFAGEAEVSPSQAAKKWIKVKGHHELAVTGEPVKAQDFNPEQSANQDQLYAWSKLRADYLGQANENLAQEYAGAPGFYPGWYWDPWMYQYTWLPGDGLFWSPFGYGFYSPAYLYGGGFIYPGYGFGGGYYRGGHLFPWHGGEARNGGHFTVSGQRGFSGHAFSGGAAGGGFHGPAGGGHMGGGFSGGHMGGGGFHGGGGGRW